MTAVSSQRHAHSCTDSHVHTLTPSAPEPASKRHTQYHTGNAHFHPHSHTHTATPWPHAAHSHTAHNAQSHAQATKSYTLVSGSHPHIADTIMETHSAQGPSGTETWRELGSAMGMGVSDPQPPAEPLSWLYLPGHPLF